MVVIVKKDKGVPKAPPCFLMVMKSLLDGNGHAAANTRATGVVKDESILVCLANGMQVAIIISSCS